MKHSRLDSEQKNIPVSIARRLIFKFNLARQNAVTLLNGSQPMDEPFNTDFYLAEYPDVAASGIDPYEHFIVYGKKEGRIGVPAELAHHGNYEDIDRDRKTVLVVSHEATRTGAPVLSLNIVQQLKKKYNVITLLLLDSGPMFDDFIDSSDVVIGPIADGRNPNSVSPFICRLLAQFPIDYAIVNSIESRAVLPGLARSFIPTITLIHEFASYVRPSEVFCEAIFWSTETIFSTSVTYEDAISEHPDLNNRQFRIIPQGRCSVTSARSETTSRFEEDARIRSTLRPTGLPDETVIILGAGTVEIRKGIDLFIACAAEVLKSQPDKLCRFIWIGRGYDPEHDGAYSLYLADQIRRSGLQDHVFLLEQTPSIEAAYQTADIFLLSPRLDPLPNVAIDAMANGRPVVCFEKATGIADILLENGFGEECVAPYFDISKLASKVLAFVHSKAMREKIGRQLQELVFSQFSIERYVKQLEELVSNASEFITEEQADIREIVKSGVARLDFYVLPWLEGQKLDEAVRFYVRAWASGIWRRKLFPGFHPGIFLEQAMRESRDPLASYLRAGRPAGPWQYDLITSEDIGQPLSSSIPIRVALHLHVYFPDLFPEIISRLQKNSIRPDLFISVPTEAVLKEIAYLRNDYAGRVVDIRVVPNRGRDIGPMLSAFGDALVENYDVFGHLHTKKAIDLKDELMGKRWRLFLLENLLGGKTNMADIILARMAADPSIGIVFPDDPHVVGWGSCKGEAEILGRTLGLPALPENFVFPLGTMFWARVKALRPIFNLGLTWEDYPSEPLPYDGTILHALERLLPFVAAMQSTRSVLTNVTGVTR